MGFPQNIVKTVVLYTTKLVIQNV